MISTISFIVLILALVFQVIGLLARPRGWNVLASALLPISALGLIVDLVLRSIRMSFIAVTNTYEALVFLSAALGVVLSGMNFRTYRRSSTAKSRAHGAVPYVVFGGSLLMMLLLALASSPLVPDAVRPPVPALRSGWLVMHVSLAFIGEAFFAVSFVSAVIGLTTADTGRRVYMDRMTYTSIAIGYPIFSIGALIFGAVWAQSAWGRYWGWDPKEIWALVTWLTYTLYLHLRISGGGKRWVASVTAVIGFLFTLFTFFGVNYLLSGLHSYR